MDAQTLEALKASIAKWERNATAPDPTEYRTGPEDCPLCAVFQVQGDGQDCNGCPVRERTGVRYCNSTPYVGAATAHWSWRHSGGTMEAAHAAARDEVAFLKSLLPEESA
jgi:hypothetical protein